MAFQELVGRIFGKGETPSVVPPEATGARTPERQFVDRIDAAIYKLKDEPRGRGRKMHFNRFDFGERTVDERMEHFFEETVLRDENGNSVVPYVDIYETQKGVLKHSKKMLIDVSRVVQLPDAVQADVKVITVKLDKITDVFGHKK